MMINRKLVSYTLLMCFVWFAGLAPRLTLTGHIAFAEAQPTQAAESILGVRWLGRADRLRALGQALSAEGVAEHREWMESHQLSISLTDAVAAEVQAHPLFDQPVQIVVIPYKDSAGTRMGSLVVWMEAGGETSNLLAFVQQGEEIELFPRTDVSGEPGLNGFNLSPICILSLILLAALPLVLGLFLGIDPAIIEFALSQFSDVACTLL